MNQEKIVEKIISNLQKNKPNKVDKILLKNKDNIELFDILLQTMEFNSLYLKLQIDDVLFKKLSIDVQKKLIEHNPSLIRMASNEIRDDKNYIEQMEEKLNENEKIKEQEGSFYEFIGPALSKNKEFLKSIQDKYPFVSLRSTTQVNYSIEELKKFFNKYPEYIASLPNNLKNDYEYLSSLMEKVKNYNEDLLAHYLNFEYDYLKKKQVKSIIINNFGENLYNRILIYALADDPKQYKNLNSEEFKKLVIMNPDVFCDSNDRLQNLISFGNKNLELINAISQTSRMTFSKVDSQQKLTDILFKLSKSFEYNLTYEQILNNVSSNWNNILPWIEQIEKINLILNMKNT